MILRGRIAPGEGPPRAGKGVRGGRKKLVKKHLPFRRNCANIIKLSNESENALLAQLDRASGYGPEGQGFESLTACQKAGHPFGCPAFCMFTGIRTGAGVNEAPVAPQSRDLASAAAEVESLTACRVVADFVSFATAFSFSKQTPSLTHSVAPPFRTDN